MDQTDELPDSTSYNDALWVVAGETGTYHVNASVGGGHIVELTGFLRLRDGSLRDVTAGGRYQIRREDAEALGLALLAASRG